MDLAEFYPPRRETGRKGDHGRVLVVGGSRKYTGCVALTALAALRAGADLATVAAPPRAADVVAGFAPDLIALPLPGAHLGSPAALEAAIEEAAEADAVVLACGMERNPESHRGLRDFIARVENPLVIDAEALHALKGHTRVLRGKTCVLTPHAGEFLMLTGKDVRAPDLEARKAAVREWAGKLGVVLLLKGHRDVASDGERVHVDEAGSPYMTKGGYGDALAGILGALLARRPDAPYEAARAGALLIGLAGARAARKHAEGTLASEAVEEIPGALRDALEKK